MKLVLWIISQLVKVYPLGFLLASGKAMKWEVTFDSDGEFIKSIEFTHPEEKDA